jgi:hypothetical protein
MAVLRLRRRVTVGWCVPRVEEGIRSVGHVRDRIISAVSATDRERLQRFLPVSSGRVESRGIQTFR